MTSPAPELGVTSRGAAGLLPSHPFLSIAPNASYITYIELVSDGRRLIGKFGRDVVAQWLKAYVGLLLTIFIPQLGIAWTSVLSYRKHGGYIYVRVPANLRRVVEPLWRLGQPVLVIVTIPSVSTKPTQGVSGA
jgi:hypothetical protein